MLIVDGLFDQEDIYGGPAVFHALAAAAIQAVTLVHLVLGPWNHGQGRTEGRGLGRDPVRRRHRKLGFAAR